MSAHEAHDHGIGLRGVLGHGDANVSVPSGGFIVPHGLAGTLGKAPRQIRQMPVTITVSHGDHGVGAAGHGISADRTVECVLVGAQLKHRPQNGYPVWFARRGLG